MAVVLARKLGVGDVIRLEDDRQAHRVERVLLIDDQVTLALRPVGLAVESVTRRLPDDAAVERLATSGD